MHNYAKWIALAACSWGGVAHAKTEVPQTLVFAVYDNEGGAKDAWKAMKETQKEGVIHIDSFAVVSKDMKGRVHVHSTQKRGAAAGAVIGALVGFLGGPAGAAAGAATGGALGYLTGNAVGIPQKDIEHIKSSLAPGTSAIVAVLDERWVMDLERSLREADAKQVMEHKIAGTQPDANLPSGDTPPPANNPPPSQPNP